MSHYPFDHSFHPGMSRCLLRLATAFRMDNRVVPWDELTGSDTIMNELAHELRRSGWPERTYEEVHTELLRLHERWKKVVEPKSETFRRTATKHPFYGLKKARTAMISSCRRFRVLHPRRARVLHRRRARGPHRRRAKGLHQRRMTMMTCIISM